MAGQPALVGRVGVGYRPVTFGIGLTLTSISSIALWVTVANLITYGELIGVGFGVGFVLLLLTGILGLVAGLIPLQFTVFALIVLCCAGVPTGFMAMGFSASGWIQAAFYAVWPALALVGLRLPAGRLDRVELRLPLAALGAVPGLYCGWLIVHNVASGFGPNESAAAWVPTVLVGLAGAALCLAASYVRMPPSPAAEL